MGGFPKGFDQLLTEYNFNSVEKDINASAATVSIPLFRIIEVIQVYEIYGVVTAALGPNHTAAHFRLFDGTVSASITLATGSTLSAFTVGSFLYKEGALGTAVAVRNAVQAEIEESATLGAQHHPFIAIQKNGVNTDIEYRYTTTDAPTSGKIKFFIKWKQKSPGANLINL